MRKEKSNLPVLFALFLLAWAVAVSQASIIYELEVFTNNGIYYNSPALDLYVEVWDQAGQVRFEFHNDSTVSSSIEGIYFDDGSLFGIASIEDGPGTKFSQGASPPELPGGATLLVPPFQTTEGFLADSDPPTSKNGIEPGEWAAIIFDLIGVGAFNDVIAELDDQTIRIGVHVISLPDGSSEAAVTPEPATLALLLLSGLSILFRARNK